MRRNFKKSKNTGFTTAFPWLVTFAPGVSGWKNILTNFKVIMETMKDNIDEHKSTLQDGDSRDFIDVCLNEISKTTDPESVFYGEEAGKKPVPIINTPQTTSAPIVY